MRFADIDPTRMTVSVHELGHAVADKAAGLHITSIVVRGYGADTTGRIETKEIDATSDEQVEMWLSGFFAGMVAEWRWCDQTKQPHRGGQMSGHFSTDMAAWKNHRKLAPDLSERRALAMAHKVVGDQWDRITHLAPKLARDGRIRV